MVTASTCSLALPVFTVCLNKAKGVGDLTLKVAVRGATCRNARLNGEWSKEKLPAYSFEQSLECLK